MNEATSPLFKDAKYLAAIEKVYKDEFLKDMERHAQLLVYDWSAGGDTELIVEDVERVNFDYNSYERYGEKMKDWKWLAHESEWSEARINYTSAACDISVLLHIPFFEAPEMLIEPEHSKPREDLWTEALGWEFAYGYDKGKGDTGLLLKNKKYYGNRRSYVY